MLHDGFLNLPVDAHRFLQIDGGQFLHLDDDVPFVHGGHERLADLCIDVERRDQQGARHPEYRPGMGQRPDERRPVERQQFARQPGFLMLHPRHQQRGQHRNDQQREYHGPTHGEYIGEGYRAEQLAFQTLQRQQRHEDDANDDGT